MGFRRASRRSQLHRFDSADFEAIEKFVAARLRRSAWRQAWAEYWRDFWRDPYQLKAFGFGLTALTVGALKPIVFAVIPALIALHPVAGGVVAGAAFVLVLALPFTLSAWALELFVKSALFQLGLDRRFVFRNKAMVIGEKG